MAPFEYADSAFASGSPLLSLLEPACLLQFLALFALGRAVGHGHPLHSHLVSCFLPARRVESRISRHQIRNTAQALAMYLNSRHQQLTVARPLLIHFVAGDDLALGLLYLDHLA